MNRQHLPPSAALGKRWRPMRLLWAVLIAAICLLVLAHSVAAAPRRALTDSCDVVTAIHTATATNSAYDYSIRSLASEFQVGTTNGAARALGGTHRTNAKQYWPSGVGGQRVALAGTFPTAPPRTWRAPFSAPGSRDALRL